MFEPITEQWLRDVGFKWHNVQHDHPEIRHWLLWLGDCLQGEWTSFEDLGIELAANIRRNGEESFVEDWFCWIRADTSHRYHRFIHIRHIKMQGELIRMIEGLTGQTWDHANNLYGAMRTPQQALRLIAENERLDLKIHRNQHVWDDKEKDPDRIYPVRGDD